MFEQTWLEEGTAQIASELFGRTLHGNGWRSDAGYTPSLLCEARPTTAGCGGGALVMTNHFTFLTNYLRNFQSKSILSGSEDSDIYGSAWLFVRWLTDTYGGADEGDIPAIARADEHARRRGERRGARRGRRSRSCSPSSR